MQNVRGKSRSSEVAKYATARNFCKVAVLRLEISGFYTERWLIKVIHSLILSELIYQKLCDIWIMVSSRGFARQFISSCLLIKNSC